MPTIHIDGTAHSVPEGVNLLHAALQLGYDLPYFCWHPALGSVGACRQCAVRQYRDEKDEKGQIAMACMVPAVDGTRCSIADAEATEFRASVIEWLMTNHPHDCPVCDEGGECHLQDMTVMTGHCSRRHRFPKRTFRNQFLGPFINHEMNRCIQCYRCTRFYNDYAGGTDFGAFGAHNHVYFGRSTDGVLENEFSGNLIEVCPTGVFTDKTLKRHYTRKWDLESAPSVCAHCSLGCNTFAGARYGAVRRILNRYHSAINGYFLCDRGRFAYEHANRPDRPRQPLVRDKDGTMRPAVAAVALKAASDALAAAKGVVAVGSPRASLEGNYALRTLAGNGRYSPGMAAAEAAAAALLVEILRDGPLPAASLHDLEQADAVLVLGEDPADTAPRMALALRQAARQQPLESVDKLGIPRWYDRAARDIIQGATGPLHTAWTQATRLDDISRPFRGAPADIARLGFAVAHHLGGDTPPVAGIDDALDARAKEIAESLRAARRPAVVTGTSLHSRPVLLAAAAVARALLQANGENARLGAVFGEANTVGATLLGGPPPEELLESLDAGKADTLVVLENDLTRRVAPALLQRALEAARCVIALDCAATPVVERADIVLPAASFADAAGTLVNHEGRAQRFFPALPHTDDLRESWRWLAALTDATWDSLDDILLALAKDFPHLAPAAEAAPGEDFRLNGRKAPRSSRRYSGRTSQLADRSLHEPRPPDDPDSPLAFSMEGAAPTCGSTANSGEKNVPSPAGVQKHLPSSLVSHYQTPGWNSVQSLTRFQEEIAGLCRGGDPGALLFAAPGGNGALAGSPPRPFNPGAGPGLLTVPAHDVFTSDELAALSPPVAERAAPPVCRLHPEDAAAHGIADDTDARIEIDGASAVLRARLDPSLARGLIALPVPVPGLPPRADDTYATVRPAP
ncbi:MAG: NADH-quinone oxidoreductase subunit NuoG [Opitutales bacterium]|nr:NADH-quinone oxidoreductase subunit NuoG [Opitutales bacterium]